MKNTARIGFLIALLMAAGIGATPGTEQLPFGPGEQLAFTVASSRFGKIGTAVMRVSADTIRGRDVLLLAFDFSAKVILFKASDQTRSWIDPNGFRSLRYTKRERSPVSKRDENVEIFPDEQRWATASGSFAMRAEQPLDELSFLYFIRTLPLEDGATYSVERHFDPARNPVLITVLRREALTDSIGTYQTIVVEMRVKDPRQSNGVSKIRMQLTDDKWRTPLRIESAMPFGGNMVMSLQARTVK